jgi:hypothetical protein
MPEEDWKRGREGRESILLALDKAGPLSWMPFVLTLHTELKKALIHSNRDQRPSPAWVGPLPVPPC